MKCPTRYCTGYCVEQLFEEQPWGDLGISNLEANLATIRSTIYRWRAVNKDRVNEIAREGYHRRKHERA